MPEYCMQLAFIGPGGPEFIVVMLVLLVMFGAKDAPRIFRKINEMINTVRNTADGFKREIMYSDLNTDHAVDDSYNEDHDDYEYDEDVYDEYDAEEVDVNHDSESNGSDEKLHDVEQDVETAGSAEDAVVVDCVAVDKKEEGDDAGKA